MKIAILGFGREGKSLLKFLIKCGLTHTKISQHSSGQARTHSDKDEIWIVDKKSTIKLPRGCRAQLGKNYLKHLEKFDILFRSPGIPYLLPEIQKAKKRGVEISSATNLFFERCSGMIVGITGTKGKGTTSTLLYKILKAANKDAHLAGNIGTPALDILPKVNKKSVVIFELSSFQLQDLKKSPHIAAVLDVFPDHLDAHKNLKEYYGSKSNIGKYQKRGDKIFFFGDSVLSRKVASAGKGKKISVNPYSPHSRELWNEIRNASRLPGEHNFKNAVMAATIAKSLGVSEKIILKSVRKFRGLEHRMEFVRRITLINADNNADATVDFYNDSAAVNPGATIAALDAVKGNIILIAGGKERGLDYSQLAKTIKKYVKSVILIGENRVAISRAIKKSSLKKRVPIVFAKNIKEAVMIAYRQATGYQLQTTKNRAVLLSPASASFDMFKDYGKRGKVFKKEVRLLK